MKRHGGQAAQARRRGEDWLLCTDCTDHPRSYQSPEPETARDLIRAFAAFAFLMLALYALVIVGAAVAIESAVAS